MFNKIKVGLEDIKFKMLKIVYIIFSISFLIYLLLPGPANIEDFPTLPNSIRSKLDGDVWQVPNVKAYFSNHYRDFITSFYSSAYAQKTMIPFGPVRLNYPPEFAYTAIKEQTESIFLEEYTYPMRDSLFINGMEPFLEDGTPRYSGAHPFIVEGQVMPTKTTLRFYPSPLWAKLVLWLGVVVSVILLGKMTKRVVFN